ncbi:hypothetical protein [Streptomyces sp. NPDC055013]
MIQGADTNEILNVLPYALARFALLMAPVTALLVCIGHRHARSKRRDQLSEGPETATKTAQGQVGD